MFMVSLYDRRRRIALSYNLDNCLGRMLRLQKCIVESAKNCKMPPMAPARISKQSKRKSPVAEPIPGPVRVPGIRIAHVGGAPEAIAEIQAYWRARSAVFAHHSGKREDAHLLEPVVHSAHVVFLSERVSREIEMQLDDYIARTDTPLILLERDTVAGVSTALESLWLQE